jgi:hypothetical protein
MCVREFGRGVDDPEGGIIAPGPVRLVPAVPYRRELEPLWLQFNDIADRLIAAAACAEGSVLSWHCAEAQLGSARS